MNGDDLQHGRINEPPHEAVPLMPPSEAEHVKEYVQLQQDELLRVLQPIQDRLGNALTWQTASLGQIQKNLGKTLRARVKNQQSALEDIGDDLRGLLVERQAEQQVRLNHSILQLPSGPLNPNLGSPDVPVRVERQLFGEEPLLGPPNIIHGPTPPPGCQSLCFILEVTVGGRRMWQAHAPNDISRIFPTEDEAFAYLVSLGSL